MARTERVSCSRGIVVGSTYVILGGGCSSAIQAGLYLLEQNNIDQVISIGRSPLRSEPFSLNIQQNPRFKYYAYHITYEYDLILELLDQIQPNVIINFAAQGETSVSWQHTWRFFETNCVTLSKLCEELGKRTWLERFVHVSTAGVYAYADFPVSETHPLDPTSPYAASKAGFDMYIKSMEKINKLPINIIRPVNIYCPGQLLHKLIPRAIMSGLKGEKLPLHGGGKIAKSYLHARDLARAIYLIVQHAKPGKFYNVAPDNPQPLYSIVQIIADKLNISFEQLCQTSPDRLLQDGGYWLNCTAVRDDTDWRPQINIEQGITEVLEWAKRYFMQLSAEPTNYVLRG